ncbi:MAG: TonB-dependent receptor [Acidobacteriota bacterium]|nr:TonB-dependent receptor [Acidobacteriota bacterium]
MKFLIVIMTVCLFFTTALAQTTGSLGGTISSLDGVIPNAQVVVRDNQTGREVTVQTGEDGSFLVPSLEFGTYTVTITGAGFKTFSATDVKIDAGREYSLNPTLQVGGIEETVTVQAGADIVNSANAELSTTVSPKQVIDLPLNGRNPLSLISLQAGANPTSSSINGQRSSSTNYTRDGINVQDNFIRTGGFVSDLPTVDDTGEFTVVTQNAGAELGNGGSSQVQLVTPRGGSEFHGALFAFNRNSFFGANNFFNNLAIDPLTGQGVKRPFLNRNQFGGKLGGPLPFFNFGEGGSVFDRGKAFFFTSYEKLILREQTASTRTVLLGAPRNGTFTYTAQANDPANGIVAGQRVTINVLTGQNLNLSSAANQTAFNNAGGSLSVDPVVQTRLLGQIPTVGNLALTNGGLTQQLRSSVNDNRDRYSWATRFDYNFNDRNNFNFVYRVNKDVVDRSDFDTGGFGTVPFGNNTGNPRFFTAAYQTTIGSSLTNEFRFAYSTDTGAFNQNGERGAFLIEGETLPFGITNPEATVDPQGRSSRQLTFRDDVNYTIGKHSLRFGGQLEKQKIVSYNDFGTTPTFFFSTTANTRTPSLTSGLFPGGISATERARANTLRYFLGGIIGSGSIQANSTSSTSGPIVGARNTEDLRYDVYGFYASDQWRVSPQLTLNFGLRYDRFTAINNPDLIFLEPVIPAGVDVRTAILNPNGTYDFVGTSIGQPGKLFNPDKNNFAPQFSFAYSPQFKNNLLGSIFGDGKTTIRGGYRISYVNDEFLKSALNAARGNDGLNTTVDAVDTLANGTTTSNLNRRLNNLNAAGFPAATVLRPPFTFAQANQADPNFFNTVFAIDPNLQIQRVQEYSFGIQREIGFQSAIEIRYVGGRSDNQIRAFDLNQVEIRRNGFVQDFLRAQRNLALSGGVSGAFNANIAGSQETPVFNQLPFGAFLDNSAITSQLAAGTPADLALVYIQNGLDIDPKTGQGVQFRPNRNAGVADLLTNNGKFRYNALQAEFRRRFTDGFSFQANYTFQKTLTDVPEDDQNRFDPLLDIAAPELEYSRADFDRTHTFNFNSIYELPFGKGKKFFNDNGLMNALLGGFQISTIIQLSSGAPISIRDPRGTLNRAGRSGRQTANSNLTDDEIKNLIGIFRTPNGVYFIDPKVIAPDGSATGGNLGMSASAAFLGQVFFNAQPGQTGNLPRAFINGPKYINVDMGLSKRIAFGENVRLQLRAEAFNLFNRANFFAPTGLADGSTGENSNIFNINSSTFGQIRGTYAPRVLQFGFRFEF